MIASKPDVSIVIVNKNDDRVRETVVALESYETVLAVEIVVVDASRGRYREFRANHPATVWIEYIQPPGKDRTIAQQRNLGVETGSGSIIVFLDSSCLPSVGWLEALVDTVVVGRESIVAGRVVSNSTSSLHDSDAPHDLDSDGYLSEFSTNNVAIRRDVIEQVGTFDEELGFAEDVDFAWRARSMGFKIKYQPNAVVSHDWGSAGSDFERAFRYGVARIRLYRKHPDRWRNLLGIDRPCLVYSLFLLGLPITFIAPWYLLALLIPLAMNRGHHPVARVGYHLVYAAGAISEFFHLPITAAQRSTRTQRGA